MSFCFGGSNRKHRLGSGRVLTEFSLCFVVPASNHHQINLDIYVVIIIFSILAYLKRKKINEEKTVKHGFTVLVSKM